MASHGNERFKIFGNPEVDRLYGDRFRIVVRCDIHSVNEDWYGRNRSNFFKAFGASYDSVLTIGGTSFQWEPREGEAYDNATLIRTGLGFIPQRESPLLTFIYETLTSTFVPDRDEKVDVALNGLRRVTRTVIAKEDTTYPNTVGSSELVHSGNGYDTRTLFLASAEEVPKGDEEGGYTRIAETWVETGVISTTEDKVGSQNARIIEAFGETPSGPVGFSIAREEVSNTNGFPTRRYTFLRNNSVLSESEDKVGSQNARVVEVFNGTPTTPSGFSIAREEVSDVDGIPTRRYTFLKDGVVLRQTDSNFSEGAKSQTKWFFKTEASFNGPVIERDQDDFEGIPTIKVTRLQDKSGSSIVDGGTNLVHNSKSFFPFKYPGIWELINRSPITNVLQLAPILRQPPCDSQVLATKYVFFQTAGSVSSADYTYDSSDGYWSPNDWSAVSLDATDNASNASYVDSETLRAYRTDSTGVSSSIVVGVDGAVYWKRSALPLRGTITYAAAVRQGPPDPVGNKYTLAVSVTPAFDDVEGTTYYKKVIVVSDPIPAQSATASLPYS